MPLAAGVRLGPYEITGWIAAGGMGDVYRAVDTRLGRSVAIKILPDETVETPSRQARFDREARAIAQLTHPSICTLYDVGALDGRAFVVMEYLEGETLSQRLLRGRLPIADAASAGADLAGALDHAHRHGIVHRDLKPSNVIVTRSGLKLLDFGLAHIVCDDAMAGGTDAGADATASLSHPGQVLGTVAYMAPEQLEGGHLDGRTDIFALGAVLYEMATGEAAFQASSQAGTIAAILSGKTPSLAAPRSRARIEEPAALLLDQVIARCLAKRPEERWESARDLGQALEWVAVHARHGEPCNFATPRPQYRSVRIALGCSVFLALVLLAMVNRGGPSAAPQPTSRWVVRAPEGSTFDPSGYSMALSPDGTHLAFIASSPTGDNGLWVRRLDSIVARKLADGAAQPFWSSDSRSIAFDGGGQLKKVDLVTGLVERLADTFVQSGAWNRNGVLLLAMPFGERRYSPRGLYALPASGGEVVPVTTVDANREEFNHVLPRFLPDGRHFLFVSRSNDPRQDGTLFAGSLESAERVQLLQTRSRAEYASGYLLFPRDQTLLAQRFDPTTLRLDGEPAIVAESIERNALTAAFSVSETGVLAYRPLTHTQLTWFTRSGRSLGAIAEPGQYANPALSADERRVAVSRKDPSTGESDVWVIDLERHLASKLTFNNDSVGMPLWSPDGNRVVYRSGSSLRMKASDGSGPEERLAEHLTNFDIALDWSNDGRALLFKSFDSTSATDLWLLRIDGERRRTPLPRTSSRWGVQARISPDGRWLAYASNERGRYEVYVRPFPSGDGKWLITPDGGSEPSWRRDGGELFYLTPDGALAAVRVSTTGAFQAAPPKRLFATRMSTLVNTSIHRNQYVASADGERFLVNEPIGPPASIVVVLNWPAGLPKAR